MGQCCSNQPLNADTEIKQDKIGNSSQKKKKTSKSSSSTSKGKRSNADEDEMMSQKNSSKGESATPSAAHRNEKSNMVIQKTIDISDHVGKVLTFLGQKELLKYYESKVLPSITLQIDCDYDCKILNRVFYQINEADPFKINNDTQNMLENVWSSSSENQKSKKTFLRQFKFPVIELENLELALESKEKFEQVDYVRFRGIYDLICHRRKFSWLISLKAISVFMQLSDAKIQAKQLEIARGIITQISNLQIIQLDLRGNFDDVQMKAITESLTKLTKLHTIYINIDFSSSTEDSLIHFGQSIRCLSNLRSLFVSSTNSKINEVSVCKFLKEVMRIPNLMSFSASFSLCPQIKQKEKVMFLIENIQDLYKFIEFQVLRTAFLVYHIEEKKYFTIQSIVWDLYID